MRTGIQQWKNNQVAYKAKGWPTYPQGAYKTQRDETTSPPITDWVPGQEPAWTPILGGKGWGNPHGGNGDTRPISPAKIDIIEASLKSVSVYPKQSSSIHPWTPTQSPVEQPNH